eukprot:c21265_g2_i1.p1 GENE.c21265_g2_i1~~c21265_g2_i1.p1  ORF type:complete len:204 (-),score=43.60 c21265_g2_i1:141-752(-)
MAQPIQSDKHELEHKWTYFFDIPQQKQGNSNNSDWSLNLQTIYTFNTVEDFWGLYKNVPQASEIVIGANFHMFKDNIKPMWEDPANTSGGKWVVTLPKYPSGGPPPQMYDEYWLNTILSMIGENYEKSELICGAVYSARKTNNKIALWISNSTDKDSIMQIGKDFQRHLTLRNSNEVIKVLFYSHEGAAQQASARGYSEMYSL